MHEHFKLLKDSLSVTKESIETVANDSAIETGLLLTSCADTLQANLIFIKALEVKVQTCLEERSALLTFINSKGLLEEFYGKK